MTSRPQQEQLTIQRLGVRPEGELAFPPIQSRELAVRVAEVWGGTPRSFMHAILGPDEAHAEHIDLADPRAAGWAFIVGRDDPRKRELTLALKRLAEHRGMPDASSPLELDAKEPEWADWVQDKKMAAARKDLRFPRYLLLAGDPEHLPFRFQALLGSKHQVGRVDFDSISDLQCYVDKVIRLESAESPITDRSAVFFGTDHGPKDPTHHSLRHMLGPLAGRCRDVLGFRTSEVKAEEATRPRLIEAVTQQRCALLYTASHGLCLSHAEPLSTRRALNGAIACHPAPDGSSQFSAGDIPKGPFLEGGVYFQFACHGYGTPDQSEFDRWFPEDIPTPASTPFVAALPKRLLAHSRGPVAYIGHVDSAYVHAFLDPEDPRSEATWRNRIHPFSHAMDQLLRVQPAALAMDGMAERLVHANAQITNRISLLKSDAKVEDPASEDIANAWIHRTDAQNYFVLGDPAARLRVPRI